MTIKTQTQEEAEREVLRLIKEEKAPIVKLSMLDSLDRVNVSDNVKGQIEYTTELYQDLLNLVYELPDELKKRYLVTLKNEDVRDNQMLESEDLFLISFFQDLEPVSSIDLTMEKYGEELKRDDFIFLHDYLLQGTSCDEKTGLRDNNLKFVGTWENGQRNIQYFPLLSEEIEVALEKLLTYLNIRGEGDEYEAVLKPMIYHGLIASLQLFQDGNTRFARTIQHVELWGKLNEILDKKIEMPIVYATRQYVSYRNQYRELIRNIAIHDDSESWNDWFKFNLARIQDGIYKNESHVKVLKSRM